jgi:hypothetical protein
VSYSFRVIREDGTARLDIGEGMAQYLPDEIIVNGHHVQPGFSSVESVTAIVLAGEPNGFGQRIQLLQASAASPRPDAAKPVPIDETPISTPRPGADEDGFGGDAPEPAEDVPTFPGN